MVKEPKLTTFYFNNEYQNVHKVVSFLFYIYVFVWYFELGIRIQLFGQIRFEFILGAILGILAIITLCQNPTYSKSKLPLIIIIYFLFLLITLSYSEDFNKSWYVFFNHVLKLSFMCLFICAFVRRPSHLMIFIAVYMLVFMKIGEEELIGKITGSLVWENQGVMRLWGPQNSIYGHPSSLAGVSIITLPFVYYLFPIVSWKYRILLLIQFIFVVNILIFTGSRTGYVGGIGMCIAIFLRSSNKKKLVIIFLAIFFMGLPMIPKQYHERFVSIYKGHEKEGRSKDSRIELMKDSLQVFLDNPMGVGIGVFQIVRKRELGKVPMETHCIYTQILSETGLIGFALFFMIIFRILKELHEVGKNMNQQIGKLKEKLRTITIEDSIPHEWKSHLFDLSFMKAITDALIIFIITRLVLGIFGHDLYEIYWWFACGLTISLANLNNVTEKRTDDIVLSNIHNDTTSLNLAKELS